MTVSDMTISDDDLLQARRNWGQGLVAISRAFDTQGLAAAKTLASGVLDAAYNYQNGPVLFKPTLSGGEKTFRTTKAGALSYFVGDDPDYPLDAGFALRGWRKTESITAASFVEENTALWMGWMIFTDRDGQTVKADKSLGFRRDAAGDLRIVLHHSSLPYVP